MEDDDTEDVECPASSFGFTKGAIYIDMAPPCLQPGSPTWQATRPIGWDDLSPEERRHTYINQVK